MRNIVINILKQRNPFCLTQIKSDQNDIKEKYQMVYEREKKTAKDEVH